MTLLKHEINSHNREYYIEKVNAPLFKAITILGNRYPDPFEYEVLHPNHQRLLRIMEKYGKFEGNNRVRRVAMALLRILIDKVEHSPNFRDRFCWFVEELREGEWKNRSYNHPQHEWNEPKPYGGR